MIEHKPISEHIVDVEYTALTPDGYGFEGNEFNLYSDGHKKGFSDAISAAYRHVKSVESDAAGANSRAVGTFIWESGCWVATSSDDPRGIKLYREPIADPVSVTTDLSARLRGLSVPGFEKILTDAADEIDRCYSGMVAWKKSAQEAQARCNAATVQPDVGTSDCAGALHSALENLLKNPAPGAMLTAKRHEEIYAKHQEAVTEARAAIKKFGASEVLALTDPCNGCEGDCESCPYDSVSTNLNAESANKQASKIRKLTDERIRECIDSIDFSQMVTADDLFYLIARAVESELALNIKSDAWDAALDAGIKACEEIADSYDHGDAAAIHSRVCANALRALRSDHAEQGTQA